MDATTEHGSWVLDIVERIGKSVRFRHGPATVRRPSASKSGDLPRICDAAFEVEARSLPRACVPADRTP